jgi:hypothetical protein
MDEKEITFFKQEQRREEILKAKLIIDNPDWLPLFEKYEEHSYFDGQIGFLLKYSKKQISSLLEYKTEDMYDQNKFKDYADKSSILFSDRILKSPDFILQRALLTFGDYLIEEGLNHSFCRPDRSRARERDENWRKVFGQVVLKNRLFPISWGSH